MTLLDHQTYLSHLRRESARFREVLADCDPAARVPGCPDWDAADLLWHLATVQLGWSRVVRLRPAAPSDPPIADLPEAERPATYAELLETFDDYAHALATELERADPEDRAWHWSDDHRVFTSVRRQAHEALIHRVDAEQAAGVDPVPLDPALAADGAAEVLGVMFGGEPEWGRFERTGETFSVRIADTGTELLVALGEFSGTVPDSGKVYDREPDLWLVDDGPDPTATLTGTAADVDLWLWHRAPDDRVVWDGDRTVRDRVAAILAGGID